MKTLIPMIAALALSSTTALAQEADVAAPAPEVAAEAAQPAATETPAPQARTVGEFGAWTVSCIAATEGAESCVARQTVSLSEEENGARLEIFLEKSTKTAPLMLTVGTPLGVAVQPGVSLMLNETDQARVWYAPFDVCMQDMCVAMSTVNTTVLEQAETPAFAFSLADYQLIGVKFGVDGLSDAVAALTEEAPEAPDTAETQVAPAAEETPAP